MRRVFILVAAAMMAFAVSASAKGFGVTAGMNFNSARIGDIKMESKAGWDLGITYLFDLPLGFSVQPSLVYTQKNADVALGKQTVGSINLPVSVQWGPDLLVLRPFLDVTPYVGYSLSNKLTDEAGTKLTGKNAFDYGVGMGLGVNVWKLQAIVRYNWNFGTLGSLKDFTGIDLGGFKADNPNYGGVSIHLAFFF